MRVALFCVNAEEQTYYQSHAGQLRRRFGDAQVKIVSGARKMSQSGAPADVYPIYRDLDTFLKENAALTRDELVARMHAQADLVVPNQYKADLDYVLGAASDRQMALRQVYLVERLKTFMESFAPDLVFMSGGGNLLRNAAFRMANALGIRAYRGWPLHHINAYRHGVRYWFSSHFFARLSDDPQDHFDYPEEAVRRHAVEFIESVRADSYPLDALARDEEYKWHLDMSPRRIAINIARLVLGRSRYRVFYEYRNFYNSIANTRLATSPRNLPKPYVLFPLNIRADSTVQIQAPHAIDILSTAEQVANILPYGYSLVIKEHPAHPGMLAHYRLKALLRYYDNIKYVLGSVRLHDLLRDAAAMITVNSTSAIEAAIQGVPVIAMGESFYKGMGLTYDVEYPLELQTKLTEVLRAGRQNRDEALMAVLCRLLRESWPPPGTIGPWEEATRVFGEGIVAVTERYA